MKESKKPKSNANQEQRTKIEKLLNEIEESATNLTAEQKEKLLIVKSITGIAFDFTEEIQSNPTGALENMFDGLEDTHAKVINHRMQQFPKGGIVGAVVSDGEVMISEKVKQAFDVSANEKTSRDYLESKGIDVDSYVKKGLAEINKIVKK